MKMLNLCGKSVVSIAVLATFSAAVAAEGSRGSRSMMPTTAPSAGRMLVAPTVSLNTFNNPAVGVVSQPVQANITIPVPVNPDDPKPDDPDEPESKCDDGKVENSDYTISLCMNDVLQCVNTGALQGGLHDLFNEDVRNSIASGMRLCQTEVDRCITSVRVDCRNVYTSSNDVWLDFNSRIVQPEYYNFVLRKTGLTPNQAENTCLLLDRNTYGASFAAVSDLNEVNTEYKNKVGAYNRAENGTLTKENPQGVAVNTVGYDGNRGHYARWDAVNAECLVRVGAYNKDKAITNSWLFGAVGNDNVAEVWEKAGSTFTCNKDLFGFSLLNDTKTAAVVGVGGGTVLGTAIGAAAGAGAYESKKKAAQKDPCLDADYRKSLGAYIMSQHQDVWLKTWLYKYVKWDNEETVDKNGDTITVKKLNAAASSPVFRDEESFRSMDDEQCRAIHRLFSKIYLYEDTIKRCDLGGLTIDEKRALNSLEGVCENGGKAEQKAIVNDYNIKQVPKKCLFKPMQVGLFVEDTTPLCESDGVCVPVTYVQSELSSLRIFLNSIKGVVDANIVDLAELNKGKEIGKGAAIGAATGAAAGGLATAITAFVERSNITCKVGDGLNSVALGKSHTIDSLKDFYVKWNLHLPDTVSPTSAVENRADWEQACSQFNGKLQDCPRVQINLKNKKGYDLVRGACKVSGTICIVNEAVAKSRKIK